MALARGGRLGRYRIVAPLGAGGMGEVWRAHDERLGRDVAIKVLPAEFAADPERLRRFEREARATAALSHPNILAVHDVGTHEGVPYLVEELLAGESLKERLERGSLAQGEALRIAGEVAKGLAAAHDKGIVHRDLKPGNVFLTRDGTAKILDFGLARLVEGPGLLEGAEATTLEQSTQLGAVVGTVAYMAPEQARGQPVDQRADVFAFGVVLYEMLTGERPFHGSTSTDTLAAILKDTPPPLPAAVPPAVAAVVTRCLAKDPGQRYQAGGELRAAFDALQTGATVTLAPWWPATGGRRLLLVAATLVVAAIAVGFVVDIGGIRLRLTGAGATHRMTSLAVLPLENLSGDPEQEYLADGMHEALITDLAQLSGLERVIGRGSVVRYKGTSTTPREIARELNVSALITGAVQRSGDRVRVTAHLIDPATEAELWAHSYERALSDVLSLQDEIVGAITHEVGLQLTPQEQARLTTARPVDPDAYEAYLKGMYFVYKKTPEGFEKGLALLEDAIVKDPAEALPHAGLALAYPIVFHGPGGTIPPTQGFPRAREAALKALELDDNLAQAHLALAAVKLYHDWDWAGAEQEFRRAIELNPNLPEAHTHFGWYLLLFDRHEEALAEVERAAELDPLSPGYTAWVAWMHLDLGNLDRAATDAKKALELDPNFPDALFVLGSVYGEKGMWTEAIEIDSKLAATNPDWRFALALDYAASGQEDKALELVAGMEREDYDKFSLWLYEIQTVLQNKDEAFRALDAAFEYHHIFLPWNMRDSVWRSEPHWQELRSRLNYPDQ